MKRFIRISCTINTALFYAQIRGGNKELFSILCSNKKSIYFLHFLLFVCISTSSGEKQSPIDCGSRSGNPNT